MSTGIMVCSACLHEVHQHTTGIWYHCDVATPICIGGTPTWPRDESDIRGKYCGRDRNPISEVVQRSNVPLGNRIPPGLVKLPAYLRKQ